MEKNKYYFADLKKFDVEHNGFEFGNIVSKGVFIKTDARFINVFDPFDERSVYVRSNCYGEYSNEGQFGTKVMLFNGTGYDDYAWILNGEEVCASLNEVENLVLYSNDFYKDRINVASTRLVESRDLHEKYRMYRILEADTLLLKSKEKEKTKKLVK